MREAFEEFIANIANFVYSWSTQIIIMTIGLFVASIFLFLAGQTAAIPDEVGPRGNFHNGIRDIEACFYALGAIISLICSGKLAVRVYKKDRKHSRNMF
jgi:hypothetical protein